MNTYKKLTLDTIIMALGNFSSKILIFLFLPLYTNILSPNEYGVADLFTTTGSLLIPILTLSITEATFRFPFSKEINKDSILTNSITIILISMFLFIPCSCLLGLFENSFSIYFPLWFGIYISTALQTCFANYTRGCGKIKIFAISGIVHTIALIAFNIISLIVIDWGIIGYLLSIILSNLASCVFLYFVEKLYKQIRIKSFSSRLLKDMLRFSTPMILSTVAWWIMSSVDKYMIIYMYDLDESGVFGVAQKIPTIITVVSAIFVQAWQNTALGADEREDKSKLHTNIFNVYQIILILSIAVMIPLIKPLALFLFKKEYFIAYKYVPFLLLACIFSCLSSFLQTPFIDAKRSGVLLVSTLCGAAINPILNYVLMLKMGIVGAACATFISFLVVFFIRFYTAQSIVKIKTSIFKMLVAIAILLVDSLFITYDIEASLIVSLMSLLALLCLYAKEIWHLIIIVFIRVLKRKNKED